MRIRWIGALGFLAIAAAACITLWFVSVLKPTSPTAYAAFAAWLVSPHAAMAAALLLQERKGAAPAHWHIVALVVSVGGVLFLADIIFWHPSAQGAIAVLMAPMYQAFSLAVLLALSALVSGRAQNRQP